MLSSLAHLIFLSPEGYLVIEPIGSPKIDRIERSIQMSDNLVL